MKIRELFKALPALCLALLLFACTVKPDNGSGGGSGSEGDNRVYSIDLQVKSVDQTSIALKWTTTADINYYKIMIRKGSAGKGYSTIYVGSPTEYFIKDLVAGENYYIYIIDNKTVNNNVSKEMLVKTAPPSLGTPQPTAEATSYSVKLNWPAIPNANLYWLYHLIDGQFKKISTTNTNSIEVKYEHAKAGESHTYKVVARSSDGKRASSYSSAVTAAIKQSNLAMLPITEAHASYEAAFSWPALLQGHEMYILRLDNPADILNAAALSEKAGSKGYAYKDVEVGKTYHYRFRLKNTITGEASPYSKLYTLTIPQPEMKITPAGLKVVSVTQDPYLARRYIAKLSWSAVAGADEYILYSDRFNTNGLFGKETTVTTTGYDLYFYKDSTPSFDVKIKAVKRNSPKWGTNFSAPLRVTAP